MFHLAEHLARLIRELEQAEECGDRNLARQIAASIVRLEDLQGDEAQQLRGVRRREFIALPR
jgi:hypothetical protein